MQSAVNTIQDVQSAIEKALECLPKLVSKLPEELRPLVRLAPPQGIQVHVSLRHPDKKASRQIKRNTPVSSWRPILTPSYFSSQNSPLKA